MTYKKQYQHEYYKKNRETLLPRHKLWSSLHNKRVTKRIKVKPESKTCTKCGIIKAISEYGYLELGAFKLDYNCKDCRNEKRRAYRLKNKDKINLQVRERYAKREGI